MVEFVSRFSGMTDLHGRWELLEEDNKLVIHFNSREGKQEGDRCLPLHPTRLVRMQKMDELAPEGASWEGTDDKGYIVHLCHWKSYLKHGKPLRFDETDAL